jgi:hypothetical protein
MMNPIPLKLALRVRNAVIVWSFLTFTLAVPYAAASETLSPSIHVVRDHEGQPIAVEAHGLSSVDLDVLRSAAPGSEEFRQRFSIVVAKSSSESSVSAPRPKGAVPSLSGRYSVNGSVVRLTPRYPMMPGLSYEVSLNWRDRQREGAGSELAWKQVTAVISIPVAKTAEQVKVEHVYPSGGTVPENHLRFYLHFSTPMSRGSVYRFIELQDSRGCVLDGAFLELTEELWDADQKRLTLLLDPARVKQELTPRRQLGSILKAGESYRLVVKAGWPNADGVKLSADFRHRFTVGPPATESLKPSAWKLSVPQLRTRETLRVEIGVPIDHAMALRCISVRDDQGRHVAGSVALSDGETVWEFTPEMSWKAERCWLVADSELEDNAGNNTESALEVRLQADGSASRPAETGHEIRIPILVIDSDQQ